MAPSYTPPTDGTWPSYASEFGHGQVPLGTPVLMPNAGLSGWSFSVTVLGSPTFAASNNLIKVSTSMQVTRVQDNGGSGSIAGGVVVLFAPGNIGTLGEGSPPLTFYMTEAAIACEQDILAVNQSVTCTVSATVSPDKIPNFFWWVGPNSSYAAAAAAWPGQTV